VKHVEYANVAQGDDKRRMRRLQFPRAAFYFSPAEFHDIKRPKTAPETHICKSLHCIFVFFDCMYASQYALFQQKARYGRIFPPRQERATGNVSRAPAKAAIFTHVSKKTFLLTN